jgi:hypothetical protein
MFNVFFEETFFKSLDDFLLSMKNYYKYFYSNTWIYDEDKIVQWYFENFENLKTNILNKINDISSFWIMWRKTIYKNWDIENCCFMFFIKSYKITFSGIRDENKKQIFVYDLKIEV